MGQVTSSDDVILPPMEELIGRGANSKNIKNSTVNLHISPLWQNAHIYWYFPLQGHTYGLNSQTFVAMARI